MDIEADLIDHGDVDTAFLHALIDRADKKTWFLEKGHSGNRAGSRIISHSYLRAPALNGGLQSFHLKKSICWDLFGDDVRARVENLVGEIYGEVMIIQLQIANLPAGRRIKPHIDRGGLVYFNRLHIPLITHPSVVFSIENNAHSLQENRLYELNNQRMHSVVNGSEFDRYHVIIDVLKETPDITAVWEET